MRTFDFSAACLRSSFAREVSARLRSSTICGVTSSARSFCASLTSDSVMSSKCYTSAKSCGWGREEYPVDGEEFLHSGEVGYPRVEGCEGVSQLGIRSVVRVEERVQWRGTRLMRIRSLGGQEGLMTRAGWWTRRDSIHGLSWFVDYFQFDASVIFNLPHNFLTSKLPISSSNLVPV